MTDDLTDLEALAQAATPGPWEMCDFNEGDDPTSRPLWGVANEAFWNPPADDDSPWLAVEVHTGHGADAAFIAAAREAVPALVAALREALAERDALAAKVERVGTIIRDLGDLDDPKFLHPQTLGLALQVNAALSDGGTDSSVVTPGEAGA